MKASLLRLKWDPKGHYLQRVLCNCVLPSLWRRQNLKEALQNFAKISDSLPSGSSSHQNYFLACCSPCDHPNEDSDFVRVWNLHQVLHPQEPVVDGFLIRWMVNYRLGLSELSTIDHFFHFYSLFLFTDCLGMDEDFLKCCVIWNDSYVLLANNS